MLGEESFRAVAEFCKEEGKLLVLDTCFRMYLPESEVYDQYAILNEVGVDYFVLEDTGKTWPTKELKAPFFMASSGIAEGINDIYSDFLLHVSPFSVRLVDEFVKLSLEDDRASIINCIRDNRDLLEQELAGTFLTPRTSSFGSVCWLEIEGEINSKDLQQKAAEHGVDILAGHQFYWANPEQGDRFVRVALVRDQENFAASVAALKEVCEAVMVDRRQGIDAGQ